MIDEFQEFFTEEDRISQGAAVLLDRIVRQGRAFGIHVLLGSQTLGGAYTVARTTLGQMVIRIALQCNEADAYLIMDDNNPAPRLLSRPGEGIYNDTAGTMEGNSPFQAVWLPDEVRDQYLNKVREQAERTATAYPGPIVFEGNAPADVRENTLLRKLLEAESIKPATAPRIWLGAPNSIKGPTEAVFHRQSGNNLLLVGQRDEATLAILSVALLLASGTGCQKSETVSSVVPPTILSPDTVASVHWLGKKRVGITFSAYYFSRIWQQPQSAQLERQTLVKLASNPGEWLSNGTNLTADACSRLWWLLNDLVQEESYLEIRQPASGKS